MAEKCPRCKATTGHAGWCREGQDPNTRDERRRNLKQRPDDKRKGAKKKT